MPARPKRTPAMRRRDLFLRQEWITRAGAQRDGWRAWRAGDEERGPGYLRLPGKPRTEDELAGRDRSSVADEGEITANATTAISVPPAAIIAWHRLAFGPRPGDIDAFNALGANDTARLTVWLDQQLAPASINDSACNARLAQSGFATLGKSLTQLWAEHMVPDDIDWKFHMQPFYETVLATFVRAVHSKRQLFELLVDFWHNHFSVYADEGEIGPTWVHSDRDAIRAHALGNFRAMLGAVAKTPAMLYYLDNAENTSQGLNENYPRELLELHSVGAENYYGNVAPANVPRDGNNVPLGYCDADVTEVAKCLTGWTVRDRWWDPDFGNTGEFFTHEDWHTPGVKTVLGVTINQGSALADGERALDVIAQHPGTARFVARKLARRLLGDVPPQVVVDAAAATFLANVAASDQIARTVRTIVLRPEFLTTWGDKVKRPFDMAVASLRGGGGDLPFRFNTNPDEWIYVDGDDSFFWMYDACGQPLFQWHPPNGYPDVKHAWKATSPRVGMWRLANTLIRLDDQNGQHYLDPVAQTPTGVRSAEELADFWARRIYGQPLAAAEQQELVEFMAQGHNPTYDLPVATDVDTQERLRTMVALIFMSPTFLLR